ncbi:MAG: hypothetical protein CO113_18475 [Elusimicrobia bacterium CG_4_9_14_3_um_filter_62_55]|nr:MAG: hypothetical protein COR54_04495 [Elusimicrobia bacterium CG22_combo_CG10-13_8_21_14_all_63_91]PJA18284.1 MAG: hypothetical protein COX66_01635 [Elusimicrobia bacterium CG_4_10_14_0_2_um_filter_63_34]PJB23425.1 MAG: hypothetical protein CO113_18475 [Elusimicrobia bacterium CG_4_9_14_3_um_filter_62_55]
MPRILFLAGAVFLLPCAAQAASASFDAPGRPLAATLQTLRESATRPPEPPSVPANTVLRPIVLAISGVHPGELGVGLEFRHLLAMWKWLFPDEEPDEKRLHAELDLLRMEMDALRPDGSVGDPGRNYIEESMREAATRRRLSVDVEGFSWSRDPGDSRDSGNRLRGTLSALGARAQGRPIYLVAHSWGTLLAHDALLQLAREGRPVAIERMVTMGSPLVPVNLVTRVFGRGGSIEEALQKRVAKPMGVARWINLYSIHDPYAGTVSAADKNIRVDSRVDAYEQRLTELLDAGADPAAVGEDLKRLKNPFSWHSSYFGSFQAKLQLLGEDLRWPIFEEHADSILPRAETNGP